MNNIDYRDQAPHLSDFYDRSIFASYTEYGIKCIDSQFCSRIQNIHSKIIQIINIPIERMLNDKWDKKRAEKFKAEGYKAEISIEDYINKKWGGWGNELRITWENGNTKEFFYWDETLVIDPTTHREDTKILEQHIKKNIHLHDDIKCNLLINLNSYLS